MSPQKKEGRGTCKGNGCLDHMLNWCRPMLYWRCAHAPLEVCTCSIGGVHMLNWSIHAPCDWIHATVYACFNHRDCSWNVLSVDYYTLIKNVRQAIQTSLPPRKPILVTWGLFAEKMLNELWGIPEIVDYNPLRPVVPLSIVKQSQEANSSYYQGSPHILAHTNIWPCNIV